MPTCQVHRSVPGAARCEVFLASSAGYSAIKGILCFPQRFLSFIGSCFNLSYDCVATLWFHLHSRETFVDGTTSLLLPGVLLIHFSHAFSFLLLAFLCKSLLQDSS
jgi:hypothetical protein